MRKRGDCITLEQPPKETAAPHRHPITRDPDVLVIGAGPSGCATALACAQRGARVLQIETQPKITERLAGEWLHPSAANILSRLGVHAIPAVAAHSTGRGFVVFPTDNHGPITLNYSNGDRGQTCHHPELVTTLRSRAAAHSGIQFLLGASVLDIVGQRVALREQGRTEPVTIYPDLIVGADGRSSVTRRSLGLKDNRVLLSYMAGLMLEDAELPFEGFGHVFLGGPGPIFTYRIGPRHIRACLDVPLSMRQDMQEPRALWNAYRLALPLQLHASFHRALLEGRIAWAANQWRPRTSYGRRGLALVGDAVGHSHPLTAMGLAMGLNDGWYLAQCKSIADYSRRRRAESFVPELLASTLYQVFTQEDAGTQVLRRGVFETWRQSPRERRLAMRLIAGDETNISQFHHAFLTALTRAFGCTIGEQVLTRQWSESVSTLRGFGWWLHRLARMNVLGATPAPEPAAQWKLSPSEAQQSPMGFGTKRGFLDGVPV